MFNKDGEVQAHEGAGEHLKYICVATTSPLQLLRNTEAAVRKAGYTVIFSGKHPNNDNPAFTSRKGAQWISVQTSMFNEFPTYELTTVLEQATTQQISATGQAAITPASDAILNDVLAVLTANADWKLRIEGHVRLRADRGFCSLFALSSNDRVALHTITDGVRPDDPSRASGSSRAQSRDDAARAAFAGT